MTSNFPRRVGAFVVLLIALAVPAFAQSNKADIVGTVTDSNGAGVSDAEVTATKVDTAASRSATTDSAGNFQLPLLDIGIYKVTATKQGFQTVTQENVTLQTQDRLRIDLTLTPGTVTGRLLSPQPLRS